MKIFFPHTSTRIAQLHALGLVLHPNYDLVPLVGLQKQHKPASDEENLFPLEDAQPEWHQLVPLDKLDTGKQNNPALLWELIKEARRAAAPARQAA